MGVLSKEALLERVDQLSWPSTTACIGVAFAAVCDPDPLVLKYYLTPF
jgi:hypothetical protein